MFSNYSAMLPLKYRYPAFHLANSSAPDARPWFPTGLVVCRSDGFASLWRTLLFALPFFRPLFQRSPARAKDFGSVVAGPRHDATFKPCRPLDSLVGTPQRISAARLPAPVSFPSSDIRPLFVHSSLFFFLRFLGLTAPAIPVRSGLRVFCFLGSALDTIGSLPECRR